MNKYIIFFLIIFLNGVSIVSANASVDPYTAINPLVARGPGPVINPENSRYVEDKNTAIKKRLKNKAHTKKQHAKNRYSHNKK